MTEKLVLKKSEWRGTDNDWLRYKSNSCLFDGEKYCCLGLDLKQNFSISDGLMFEVSFPESIVDYQGKRSRFGQVVEHDGVKRAFSTVASVINDNHSLSVEEKVRQVRDLYAQVGVEVEYVDDTVTP